MLTLTKKNVENLSVEKLTSELYETNTILSSLYSSLMLPGSENYLDDLIIRLIPELSKIAKEQKETLDIYKKYSAWTKISDQTNDPHVIEFNELTDRLNSLQESADEFYAKFIEGENDINALMAYAMIYSGFKEDIDSKEKELETFLKETPIPCNVDETMKEINTVLRNVSETLNWYDRACQQTISAIEADNNAEMLLALEDALRAHVSVDKAFEELNGIPYQSLLPDELVRTVQQQVVEHAKKYAGIQNRNSEAQKKLVKELIETADKNPTLISNEGYRQNHLFATPPAKRKENKVVNDLHDDEADINSREMARSPFGLGSQH